MWYDFIFFQTTSFWIGQLHKIQPLSLIDDINARWEEQKFCKVWSLANGRENHIDFKG